VLASLLAIPLGILLYLALYGIVGDTTEDAVIAPWWSLAFIPIGTVLVVVAATSLPARLATRIHTAARSATNELRPEVAERSQFFSACDIEFAARKRRAGCVRAVARGGLRFRVNA
jgi:hypothetical protein